MINLKSFYYWFRNKTSKPGERGEASSGIWQDRVRETAFNLCDIEKGNILEVGCGEGLFLKRVIDKKPGLKPIGVDISIEQLLRAKDRLKESDASILKSDAARLPFRDNTFDMVICVNVFMNLQKEELMDRILDEIRRVCAKSGRIIFDIRNRSNMLIRLKYKLVGLYDATIDASQLKMYRPKDIEKKIKQNGMTISRKVSIGFPRGRFAPIILFEVKK